MMPHAGILCKEMGPPFIIEPCSYSHVCGDSVAYAVSHFLGAMQTHPFLCFLVTAELSQQHSVGSQVVGDGSWGP